MSDSDALMWDIESDPGLRSTITAIALLDRSPEWKRVRSRVAQTVHAYPRLRQRVAVAPLHLGTPLWVDDDGFDLDFHVRRVAAPPPGDLRAVLDLAAPLASTGFDRARPLWEMTLVEGVGDGAAAILKVHHSMADGVGSIAMAADLFDLEPRPTAARLPRDRAAAAPSTLGITVDALGEVAATVPRMVRDAADQAARAAVRAVRDPAGAVRRGAEVGRSVARLLTPTPTPLSPLMVDRGLFWHFDVDEAPIKDMKAAAERADGTVNDAFLTVVTGALARYHQHHGIDVEQLRVLMPVNIRGDDDPRGGNHFVPARFPLPVATDDPLRRMRQIKAITREWRDEPSLGLTDTLATILELLPLPLTVGLFGSMQKGVDMVATNVPGVRIPVWFAGAEVTRIFAMAPPSGAAASFSLLSHRDLCCFGLNIDRAAIPDTDVLGSCFADSLVEVTDLGRRRRRRR